MATHLLIYFLTENGFDNRLWPKKSFAESCALVHEVGYILGYIPKQLTFFKKLRRPFGTRIISLKFYSKMLPKKKFLTLATAAVRLSRPLAT